MSFPKCPDVVVIAEGNDDLLTALRGLDHPALVMLAELVSERGDALWNRYTDWCKTKATGGDRGFSQWLYVAIVRPNMSTIMYPKGCTLDAERRRAYLAAVRLAVGALNNNQLIGVYFEVDPQYSNAREVSCRACPMTQCRHFFPG